MEYYSAVKRNEIPAFLATCMDLEIITEDIIVIVKVVFFYCNKVIEFGFIIHILLYLISSQ